MGNYSRQRKEILDVLKEIYTHPTAEEVFLILKSKNSTASKSTVYRNLNLLVKEDVIKMVSTAYGPDRYDYIRHSHNHVVCTMCGKVFDFDYNFKSNKLLKLVKEETGVDASLDNITIQGICNNCNKS